MANYQTPLKQDPGWGGIVGAYFNPRWAINLQHDGELAGIRYPYLNVGEWYTYRPDGTPVFVVSKNLVMNHPIGEDANQVMFLIDEELVEVTATYHMWFNLKPLTT